LTSRLTNTPLPVASGSTTPTYEPGGPPPISPALPPLEQVGEVPAVKMGMGLGEQRKSGEGELLFSILSSCFVFRFRGCVQGRWNLFKFTRQEDIKIKEEIKVTPQLLTPDIYTHQYHPCSLPTKKHASLRCATIHRSRNLVREHSHVEAPLHLCS
jgi:hypothetical protein